MTDTDVLSVSDGNFRLVIGQDLEVSAEEIAAAGRTIRFRPGELAALNRVIGDPELPDADDGAHTLLVISDELFPEDGETLGVSPGGGQLGGLLRSASEEELAVILTEAVARAWFRRLSLAGTGPLTWTRGDSEAIGRLGMQGRPLLSEYLAERRRAVRSGGYNPHNPAVIAADEESAREVLCSLLEESGSRVQFGAAELAVASDAELRTIVRAATSEGGWLESLRLAVAAEEALAADLLLETLATMDHRLVPLERWTRLRAGIVTRVLACRGRVPIFEEVVDRLERVPEPMWEQIFRRGRARSARYVDEDVTAYLAAFTEMNQEEMPDSATARRLLQDLDSGDDVMEAALIRFSGPDDGEEVPSFQDLADALGEEFARRLPVVEERLRELRETHPEEDTESLTRKWRKNTLAELNSLKADDHDSRESASEIVIDYVLVRSLLAGVSTSLSTDLAKLGDLLLRAANWSYRVRETAGPVAETAVNFAVGQVWPMVQVALVELLGNKLAGHKPSGRGLPRQAFNFVLSKARIDRLDSKVQDAAGPWAEGAARVAVDRSSNWLLLLAIDRLVRKLT